LGRRTPLYDLHVELGARMVDFGGWDMPVNYGSQIEEHHAVRRDAGIFDVSHMCVIDAHSSRVREFLSRLIANDVARLTVPGKALYSCMLNEAGGVIDDLIVYYLDDSYFRIVVNAGTRDKDLAWMRGIAPQFGVELTERTDLDLIVEPPAWAERGRTVGGVAQREKPWPRGVLGRQVGDWFVARTGYTAKTASKSCCRHPPRNQWRALNARASSPPVSAHATRCAGSRHEFYGNDMDEPEPLEWGSLTVSFDNPARFHRRKALEALKAAGLKKKFVALLLEIGVLRGHRRSWWRAWRTERSPAALSRPRWRSPSRSRAARSRHVGAGRRSRQTSECTWVKAPSFARVRSVTSHLFGFFLRSKNMSNIPPISSTPSRMSGFARWRTAMSKWA
jgi:aminomethyltransferase